MLRGAGLAGVFGGGWEAGTTWAEGEAGPWHWPIVPAVPYLNQPAEVATAGVQFREDQIKLGPGTNFKLWN